MNLLNNINAFLDSVVNHYQERVEKKLLLVFICGIVISVISALILFFISDIFIDLLIEQGLTTIEAKLILISLLLIVLLAIVAKIKMHLNKLHTEYKVIKFDFQIPAIPSLNNIDVEGILNEFVKGLLSKK